MKSAKKMTEDELRAFKAAMEHIYGKNGLDSSRPGTPIEQINHSTKRGIDSDGQPINRRLREKDVGLRQIDELIGLLKGILSDKTLVEDEVRFLASWLDSNTFASSDWPGSVLSERILRALRDNILDPEEIQDIREIIESIVNGGKDSPEAEQLTTELPIDKPPPVITFEEKTFCFTGKLIWGKRQDAELAVADRGGKIGSPSKKLNYLVLGQISSRDWKHSTHGLKILDAVSLKEGGNTIWIVTEKDWAMALGQHGKVSK
jgi:hypothetical protein